MIRSSFKRNSAGQIVSFEIDGHAGYAEHGEDIVCSAVSVLAFTTVNGIEALAGFTPLVSLDEENEGYLAAEILVNVTQEQTNIAQILLENLLLGLQMVQAEHPECIQIITEKTGGADEC